MGLFDLDIGIRDIVKTVADFIPNENERNKAQAQLEIKIKDFAHKINLEQIKNNQIEATHRSVFVAGWRPFIGWVCGVGVCWAFVLQPMASWLAVVLFTYHGSLPASDIANLILLLGGMLGMGGLRTYEKKQGLTK